MSLLEAIIIGIIQGATEFLPISSDGHLVLIPAIFGLSQPDLVLIGLVHAGTLVAILSYFARDLWAIGRAWLAGLVRRDPWSDPNSRLGWFMLLGSIPAAIVGLALKDFFEQQFQSPTVAAAGLLVTAVFLVVGERLLRGTKTLERLTAVDTLIIGAFQVLALLPGVSRSGSTIAAGLWRGLDRPTAARFSFLVGLPAIAGVSLLSIIDIFTAQGSLPNGHYLAAFLAAAVVGYLCIAFLLSWVKRHSLYPFAIYCAVVGLLYLLFTLVL
ncbi:Undecaprenyl-diphosphatase [Candidatus Promineifilum breve]|uniref:Undecaprenyl-diphosphatase n=1 Tax=Candidatus Promineifilum breve TaxID=1806508 RepID=A0A1A9C7K4_9CHLR|nr:undecaprenyl-diphosphate phosphatase [Candidatus Promineifilum breve]SBU01545.1 Undecaprenyl-diphosphatase [Candidatus Promineifilum breve]